MTQKHISHLFKFSITILGPFSLLTFKIHTIKPVYNGYPWDPKKWPLLKTWWLLTRCYYKLLSKL